jgi:hypothetical protein
MFKKGTLSHRDFPRSGYWLRQGVPLRVVSSLAHDPPAARPQVGAVPKATETERSILALHNQFDTNLARASGFQE